MRLTIDSNRCNTFLLLIKLARFVFDDGLFDSFDVEEI